MWGDGIPFVCFSDLSLGCAGGDGKDGVVIWWCC